MGMKKFFLMAAVATMTATGTLAQNGYDDTKHEVAISMGLYSNSQWIDVLENATMVTVSGSAVHFDNDHFTGPLSAEYFYHAKPWLGVGGIFAFGTNKQDIIVSNKKSGEVKHSYFTLMPAVKFDWLRKKNFGMYSKLAVGMTLRTESTSDLDDEVESDSETAAHVNWQISALGIEVGSPTLRAFAEVGTGEQGFALVGLRYKFGK